MSDIENKIDELRTEISELTLLIAGLAEAQQKDAEELKLLGRKIWSNSAVYLGDNVAMTYIENGVRAYVDTRSRDVGVHILHGGHWEPNYTIAFRRLIVPGMKVLDIGANLGWYSLVAAPLVGVTGKVLAVEPNEQLASLIFSSFSTNGFLGFCEIVNLAVSDQPGLVDLFIDPNMPGGAHIRPASWNFYKSTDARRKVQAVKVDDLLDSKWGGAPDVIKMDIEGWEGMAFRGMERTLSHPTLKMMIEWSPAMDNTPSPRRDTADLLHSYGFRAHKIDLHGNLEPTTWDEIIGIGELINLIVDRDSN